MRPPTHPQSELVPNPIPAVLLITGPDYGLKCQRVDAIRNALVAPQFEAFDYAVVDGRSAKAEDILAAARVLPFASQRRVVMVRAVERLRPADVQAIADALPGLCPKAGEAPTVCLMLLTEEEDQEKRRGAPLPLEKAVRAANGLVLNLKPLTQYAAAATIQRMAAEMGVRVGRAAAEALANRAGTDTDVLDSELRKLAEYAGGQEITAKHVEEAASASAEYTVFALTDAVGKRDRAEALKALHSLMSAGVSAYRVLPMLARQFRLLWQAKVLAEHRMLNERAMKSIPAEVKALLPRDPDIGRMAWRADAFAREVDLFSWKELERNLGLVFDADLRIKGIEDGAEDPRVTLEMLVMRLCTREPAPTARAGERQRR